MRTAGLKMNDVWAHRVLRERGVETFDSRGRDAEISVLVDGVTLNHRGPEEKYRPYLHLSGELTSVHLAEPLPYGIDTVTYEGGSGDKIDAFYEFDDEQLVALARKGYFRTGFVVPEQITGIEWELPAKVDALVLAPVSADLDQPPVVFLDVEEGSKLEVDLESCGYDLTEYFADHSGTGPECATPTIDGRDLRARSDAIDSLFKNQPDLGLEMGMSPAKSGSGMEQAAGPDPASLSGQLAAVEAELADERDQLLAERGDVAGSPENLYRERIASTLREETEATTATAEGEPAAQQSSAESRPDQVGRYAMAPQPEQSNRTLEERKREVARRAADLDFGDEAGHETSLGG